MSNVANDAHVDEEALSPSPSRSPSRRRDATTRKPTPFPWQQFSIILFLQLAEPLTSQVISPFAPELMRDVGATEEKVGYYVGMMQSIFFATQALTVLHWSRISDTIGRKPVILGGLFGLSISMFCFGLSKTFWGLVFSRSLAGALNGNIGVIKSIIPEITDSTNIAKGFAYMPIAWSSGSTIAPLIGGSLSHPAERFPSVFGSNAFLIKYPYFLPCAVPATFSLIAWTVTFFYLKETVPNATPILQFLRLRPKPKTLASAPRETSPLLSKLSPSPKSTTPPPLHTLLTPHVILAAGNYALLALTDIAFRSIQPLFFHTPIPLGGLSLPTPTIGSILSSYGILNGILQPFSLPYLVRRWGHRRVYLVGVVSFWGLIVSLPVMNWVARREGGVGRGVWVLVGVHTVLSTVSGWSYGSIFIYIAASSPSKHTLGATNGLSQMLVSIMRTIGPAISNSFFSFSIENKGWMGLGGTLVYWVLGAIVGVAVMGGMRLPERVWEDEEGEGEEEEEE